MKKIELLAPAQNKECAKCAIDFGADAVYIGANLFGARQNAKNSIEDIEEIINYAHKFNVKIYITINTILTDDELIEAEKLINKLYKIKADGIIFQDFGLLKLDLPNIKLIASTQCDIRTPEKVKFFEKIGIKRVILARELDLKTIENICKNTDIEVETFIHGALCVSYSGQCYLSYKIGKRSANRGECAQACRKKYSLVDENGKILLKDKYLLSLKDFSAKAHLKRLLEAGVTSFKIEGRLKDENYVKNTVLYYRRLLDGIFEETGKYKKASSGEIFEDFVPKLEKTFNRGFCNYFLEGRKGKIWNFDVPNFRGEIVGKVNKVGKNFIEILSKSGKAGNTGELGGACGVEIMPQDGLNFVENGTLCGILVNSVEAIKGGYRIFPNTGKGFIFPKVNCEIYKNRDAKFEATLLKSGTKRRIGVDLKMYEGKIEATDEDKNTVLFEFEAGEIAKNGEMQVENWKKALNKTGDTIFYVKSVDFNCGQIYFYPVARMNEIRREVFNRLESLRAENYVQEGRNAVKCAKYPADTGDYRLNAHNNMAEEFYKDCGCEVVERSLESTNNFSKKELMRTKHCLRYANNICLKKTKERGEKLYLIDEKGAKYPLLFDCKNCEMIILSNVTK